MGNVTETRFDRYDRTGRLMKFPKVGGGGYRLPAQVGRTGIQEYRRMDGTVIRELRTADEVFHPDSLASLASIPVTVGHPTKGVDAETWKVHSRGHVSDAPSERKTIDNADWIVVDTVVTDSDTQNDVASEKLCEVSLGYSVDLVYEPGITEDGQSYDARQTNIRYNHLALLPKGGARAGRDARLTIDGHECSSQLEREEMPGEKQEPVKVVKIVTFDGVEYERGSESHVDALVSKLAAADKSAGELEGRVAKLEADLKSARNDAIDTARIDNAIAFRDVARKVLGEDYKFDGKSEAEVRKEAVVKALPDTKLDGKSDDFVEGLYTSVLQNLKTSTEEVKEESKADSNDDVYSKHISRMDSGFADTFAHLTKGAQ